MSAERPGRDSFDGDVLHYTTTETVTRVYNNSTGEYETTERVEHGDTRNTGQERDTFGHHASTAAELGSDERLSHQNVSTDSPQPHLSTGLDQQHFLASSNQQGSSPGQLRHQFITNINESAVPIGSSHQDTSTNVIRHHIITNTSQHDSSTSSNQRELSTSPIQQDALGDLTGQQFITNVTHRGLPVSSNQQETGSNRQDSSPNFSRQHIVTGINERDSSTGLNQQDSSTSSNQQNTSASSTGQHFIPIVNQQDIPAASSQKDYPECSALQDSSTASNRQGPLASLTGQHMVANANLQDESIGSNRQDEPENLAGQDRSIGSNRKDQSTGFKTAAGFSRQDSSTDSSQKDSSTGRALSNEHISQDTTEASDVPHYVEKNSRPGLGRQRSHDVIGEADRTELVRVATALSRRHSTVAGGPSQIRTLDVLDEEDAELDPKSDRFDLRKWILSFAKTLQKEGVTAKRTGVTYRNVDIFGQGAAVQVQETVGSLLLFPLRIGELFSFGKKKPKQILHSFDGLIKAGELLIVLGRPGSGCSTLLKTLCGELHGLSVGGNSVIHYDGIPQKQMKKEFKGEAIYNQEVDKHFPHLTVGQTLEYAAAARTPSQRLKGMSRKQFSQYVANVVMAAFGLSHTRNTKVGNDFIRGVSGGERKRVSIAEMTLSGSPFLCWDNSTRGLDSATAYKFVQSLRMVSDIGHQANAIAIYQASQAIYELFDKVTVLYEGRQIYFGPANKAKAFFERQGWHCPARQTTGDFLTSVTNPQEREPQRGMEKQVPRTPEEFERYWRKSREYEALIEDIQNYEAEVRSGDKVAELREQKMMRQANHVRPNSPYTISILMQIRLNTKRAYQRLWNDKSSTLTSCCSQIIIALIVGSIFFGNPDATAGFYAKGSVLFIAILVNALTAISEINSLYAQRPIVEKHASYAFCHPATEAAAGIVADIPIKFLSAVCFNIVLYFLSGLRREPSQFFIYFLITFVSTFVMSAVFRTMAAITKTVSQAMSLSGVLVLALVIYTGFTITVPDMHPWFSWIRWINPIFYGFEILVANEFHGRRFTCSSLVPQYSPLVGDSYICSVAGAVAGERTVSGDAFIAANYNYYYSHVWRNFGILLAFLFAFMIMYFVTTELNSSTASTAEALVFQRGHVPAHLRDNAQSSDGVGNTVNEKKPEASSGAGDVGAIEPQKDIFTWREVVYDIHIKNEPRRLLDHVSGWVRPGTLTALMGVSGAGKTTLLDVLAQRTTMGVITGDMFVNGKPRDPSFQRKTGYVQQQDLHLETSTVRESLRFSAMLRQPASVSKEEKFAFVEEVIKMLEMEEFADAIVGVPGEGLNVRERKLLTIGVELAAKPKLLLFLDEPTSGLDSQSSWAICAFLRKLADAGQAILCTVHQPSAVLFQAFDRLLFLAKGGKTVYFGDIGQNSRILLDYFESNGARICGDAENPAEYMLEIVNNGTNGAGEDWHSLWKASKERVEVQNEIEAIHAEKLHEAPAGSEEAGAHSEFAMPFMSQLWQVVRRIFQQYWRMPGYVFAKFALGTAAGLFIGFSFYRPESSQAGMQTVIFSIFMITTIFSTLVQQIQPLFVTQRSLYEVREKPSKAYSWKAFIIANILVEIPYQIMTGILIYACWYFPVMGANQSSERQGLVLLFIVQIFIYAGAFAQMTIVAMPDAQTAAHIVTLLSLMSITFCGVLQTPEALPGFWIFMYRVSPFTYWVGGIAATELHGRPIECADRETLRFPPPSGQTCGEYMAPYLQQAPGQLQNPQDTVECRYCSLSVADQFLAGSNIYWSERWRNYGIVWAYVVFNFFMAVLLYYVFRVKKWNRKKN